MLKVYLNYPLRKLSVHADPGCTYFKSHPKPGQRHEHITAASLSGVLARFAAKEHRFDSKAGLNDIWLIIELGDEQKEQEALEAVRYAAGQHYRRLLAAVRKDHC